MRTLGKSIHRGCTIERSCLGCGRSSIQASQVCLRFGLRFGPGTGRRLLQNVSDAFAPFARLVPLGPLPPSIFILCRLLSYNLSSHFSLIYPVSTTSYYHPPWTHSVTLSTSPQTPNQLASNHIFPSKPCCSVSITGPLSIRTTLERNPKLTPTLYIVLLTSSPPLDHLVLSFGLVAATLVSAQSNNAGLKLIAENKVGIAVKLVATPPPPTPTTKRHHRMHKTTKAHGHRHSHHHHHHHHHLAT